MKYRAASLLFLCSLFLPALGKDKAEIKDWEWRGAKESGAWLHTERRGSELKFSLELNRGAPSYNSGEMSGELIVKNDLAIYQPSELPRCTMTFAFTGRTVKVQQSGSDSDCGFGYGVMADHILTLKKSPK